MSRDNMTTPERGQTMYNGATIDTNNLSFVEYEGMTKVFEDIKWGDSGVKSVRLQGRQVVCRLCRNLSGATIYAKRLVTLDPANPGRITGNAVANGQECYPVDEFLPATGVPNGDLCWVVIKGPAIVLTPIAGAEFSTASIAAGAILTAATTNGGSTAAGTTAPAGRLSGFEVVASTTIAQTALDINIAVNYLGKAISAVTSGQTNSDCLVDVRRPGGGYP